MVEPHPVFCMGLMVMIALSCNLLIGYSTHRTRAESTCFWY